MRGAWRVPIEVELGAVGSYRVMSDTVQAAEALVYQWPVRTGPKWLVAMQACLDALEGKLDAEVARKAFIAAAVHAEVGVRPWQRNLPQGRPIKKRWTKRRRA
jgi:hypothetical protein